MQGLPGSVDEHRHPNDAEASADLRFTVRTRRPLGDDDLATSLDPGQELVVGGGVIEQHRHPGIEVRGPPLGDRQLEDVAAPEVIG